MAVSTPRSRPHAYDRPPPAELSTPVTAIWRRRSRRRGKRWSSTTADTTDAPCGSGCPSSSTPFGKPSIRCGSSSSLFGSIDARGEHRDSDIDLLVVLPEVNDKHEVMVALLEATVDVPVPVGLIPTDPDEIARCGNEIGSVLHPAPGRWRTGRPHPADARRDAPASRDGDARRHCARASLCQE